MVKVEDVMAIVGLVALAAVLMALGLMIWTLYTWGTTSEEIKVDKVVNALFTPMRLLSTLGIILLIIIGLFSLSQHINQVREFSVISLIIILIISISTIFGVLQISKTLTYEPISYGPFGDGCPKFVTPPIELVISSFIGLICLVGVIIQFFWSYYRGY